MQTVIHHIHLIVIYQDSCLQELRQLSPKILPSFASPESKTGLENLQLPRND